MQQLRDSLPPTIGLDELAGLLLRKPGWLRRHWRRLHRDYQFPRTLPGTGMVWSRRLVTVWIESSGETTAHAIAQLPYNDNGFTIDHGALIEAQRRMLMQSLEG